jgi:hypothetical protein
MPINAQTAAKSIPSARTPSRTSIANCRRTGDSRRRELDVELTEAPTDLAALAPSFRAASLFIDGLEDCPGSDGKFAGCYIEPTCYFGFDGLCGKS